ncbi:MAG: murein biosynthesis integral membrane protein MurJ [Candidatus Saccharimonadia bacterium]
MNRVISKANRKTSVGVAAFLISASFFASRLLGLLRDRLLAAHFGIGPMLDAYTSAFSVPDLLFTLLVSGAFAVAFIPVLTEHLSKEEQAEAWEVSSILLNLLMILTLGVGVLCFIFTSPLVKIIAPGFDPYRHNLTVNLTRIMLITPFFFAVSSVIGGIQQAVDRFFFYAIASVFYNVGIIFGIVFLSQHYSIYGVAIGVVIGVILQTLIQFVGLFGVGFHYHFSLDLKNKSVVRVVKLIIPRILDQGIDQINYIVERNIGSFLATGSLTAYYYANNLKNVPLSLFGAAIATAAFPKMANDAVNNKIENLIENFVINARLILFLVIPSATIAILMRGYIVRLLFGFGNATTANILGWFAGVIIFQSLFLLVTRVFYSLHDSKTPLYTSIFAIAFNVLLSIYLAHRFGVVGLPMAQSIASIFETTLLIIILKRKLGSVGGMAILRGVFRMLIANTIMAGIVYLLVAKFLPLYRLDRGIMVVGPKFLLICLAAGLAYLLPSYILRVREAKQFVGRVVGQLFGPLV